MELVLDFNFIMNHLPRNAPENFRRKNITNFLKMLHPTKDINQKLLERLEKEAVHVPFSGPA